MDGDTGFEDTADLPLGEPSRTSGEHPIARGVGQATLTSARATGRAARGLFRLARRASHAEGAGRTGLYRLIELHAFNAAGDAAVAISLAGTLFFTVPGDDSARGQVALFLGLTMLPFAVVAPLIGPFLDRFSHGRRWAIGATFAIRGFLCWLLAGLIAHEGIGMFPAVLGVLVASKAYGVTRAAAVPRVVPEELGLVRANSRISLSGIVGAAVSAPLAGLASLAGPEWSLRYGFVVFACGTVLAILLPKQVDNTRGEEPLPLPGSATTKVPAGVVTGLRANSGLRMLSGFLTLFMAFLLRAQPFDTWPHKATLILGLVIGAAGLGNTLGITLGNVLKGVKPAITVRIALFAVTVVAIVTAVHWSLVTAMALGLATGMCQAFGKLSLDSMIQTEIPEASRSSAFSRSETLLQLSWVAGAFVGIALPLNAHLGLTVISTVLVSISLWVVLGNRITRRAEGDPVNEYLG